MPYRLLWTSFYFDSCFFVHHWGRTSPHIATSDNVIRRVWICVDRVSFFSVSLIVLIRYRIPTRNACIWKVLSWVCCHGSLQSLFYRNLLVSNGRVFIASTLSTTYWLSIDRDNGSRRNICILHWGWHLSRHIFPRLHWALWSTLTIFPPVLRLIRRSIDNSRLHLCELYF